MPKSLHVHKDHSTNMFDLLKKILINILTDHTCSVE